VERERETRNTVNSVGKINEKKRRDKMSPKEVGMQIKRQRMGCNFVFTSADLIPESLLSSPFLLYLSIFYFLLQPLFTSLLGRGISLYQNKWVFVKILHLSVIAYNQRNSTVFCRGADGDHLGSLSFCSPVSAQLNLLPLLFSLL